MQQEERVEAMQIKILGIDLGKNLCSLAGLDGSGQVVVRRRVRRENLLKVVSHLRPSMVAMEACGGAHHLGRLLRDAGFEVRLMSPEYVRPYVKAQKNDDRDAEAIAEAATRPTMRFVELKSAEQLDMQVLHRARDRLVAERTALINQLRAVLMERGIVIPQGWRKLNRALAAILEGDEPALSRRVRMLINDSVAVSREHRRAKTDRLDTGMLMRVFLGWLRGERGHCRMVAIPTLEEEDAKRPSRERESLVGERTRIINRMKSALARLGIRGFKPALRKAPQRLEALRTPEDTPIPPICLTKSDVT